MEKWILRNKQADIEKLARENQISPFLARLLVNRSITENHEIQKFLKGTLKDCYSPWELKDMEKACTILLQAIEQHKKICVIGDYDVDGICASYILTEGLRACGGAVDTVIPHRIFDGYGLNIQLIEQAKADGVELIITCDNGIAAVEQIAYAKDLGLQVIVTDHHEVIQDEIDGEKIELLPKADAIINPKQRACTYPFPGICGALVVYKLMQALSEKTGSLELANRQMEFLQFAAMATICDVMELRDENRIIVKYGIEMMKQTENAGLKALIYANSIDIGSLSCYHCGFVIGPCLNATGRLDTAKKALALLMCREFEKAAVLANELKLLNDERKQLTQQGVLAAKQYIQEQGIQEDKVYVIYLPEVHESIAGIIAGRIREAYNHPVFVFTNSDTEGECKGSGRSIEAYHMHEALTQVKAYLLKFGGHKLAAGLSLKKDNLEPLRQELNRLAQLEDADFAPKIYIDMATSMEYGALTMVEEMSQLMPYGTGNPKPLFAERDLLFVSGYLMGRDKNVARFKVQTKTGCVREFIYFGNVEKFREYICDKFEDEDAANKLFSGRMFYKLSVIYTMDKNVYQGRERLQLEMKYYC